MNKMTIINRLKNLKTIDIEIMSKRQEIVSLRSKVLKSPQFTNMPKGTHFGNATEKLNLQIIDDTDRINKEIAELYSERQILIRAIDSLDNNLERNVIRLYYLNNYTWLEISRQLNWSIRQLQRFKDNGVAKLEKILVN
ncbi:DUF1492 domain-containing protein [Streptococcus sp. sy004]|uniref:DUF1492 domain-containing protein n=1 Tax=Streptococcus sp. sy004 TaxID=2600149 RepID=UPI0011B7BF9D|nr:DUF1492 domain-containing protein [Streptococcus sp. sy004]TWT12063.1 DUF1492 domain-containing protein [Streptococcus sp. sy004]